MYMLKGKKYEHQKHKSVETQIQWQCHWRTGSSNGGTLWHVWYTHPTNFYIWKANQQKEKEESGTF